MQKPPKLLRDVLQENPHMCFDFTDATNGWLKNNTEVNSFINGVEILSNQEGGRRMGYTIFGIGGLAPTLTSTTSRHYERYFVRNRYRRLTNVEYARLQGFDDDWCKTASTYDQYGLFGNAVPPAMVEWVATRLAQGFQKVCDGRLNAGHQAAAASSRS
jgi:DNA (cytosine-5)-methyltransferase 1